MRDCANVHGCRIVWILLSIVVGYVAGVIDKSDIDYGPVKISLM
jgi:hypothetical protein